MYTGKHARLRPLQPAFIMAASGEPGPIASWRALQPARTFVSQARA